MDEMRGKGDQERKKEGGGERSVWSSPPPPSFSETSRSLPMEPRFINS
jgi:hypothetical protein